MDVSAPSSLLGYISGLSYFILFLLFIWEGPIVNYVASFAASFGVFNIFIVFILAVLGNLVGDIIYYALGRLGRKSIIDRYFKKSLHTKKMKKLRVFLKDNPFKALVIIKVMPFLCIPGLIMAGIAHVSFKKYILYTILVSIVHCGIIAAAGYYSGELFNVLFKYVNLGIFLAILLLIIIFFATIWIKKLMIKFSKKIEKV